MSNTPRHGGPRRKFGFELLKAQVLELIAGEMEWIVDDEKVGDSEIERLFFLSLRLVTQFAGSEFRDVELAASEADEARLMAEYRGDNPIYIVRPQAHVLDYRVDFLIHTHDRTSPIDMSRLKWCRLVVECDGHDFHERTKEQAAKDRSRDRNLTSQGYDVFRFTGSELWTDPFERADQVLSWGVKTW